MKSVFMALLLATCASAPATAQMQCAPSEIIDQLNEDHGMEIASQGRVGDASIETYSNPNTQRFVVIARRDDGLSCLIVSGSDYRQLGWGQST